MIKTSPVRSISTVLVAAVCASRAGAAVQIPLENAGFEDDLKGWTATRSEAMFAVTNKAASVGKKGLLITDEDARDGGLLISKPLPVTDKAIYLLRFWGRMDSEKAGTNIKLEFQDENQKPLKGVTVPRGWPGVGVKYPHGFTAYEARVGAPEGAKTMQIVIEAWGSSVSKTSIDDLTLHDITDGKMPEPDVPALLKEGEAARKAGKTAPKVIIKVDDLKQYHAGVSPRWIRLADEMKKRRLKAGIGVVFDTMENASPKYLEWIKGLHETGLFEFWNHGFDHKSWDDNGTLRNEFEGPYERQKDHMTRANRLAREKLGFPMRSFGPPGGSGGGMDANSFRVLEEDPDIKVIMFPGPAREIPGKFGLHRNYSVNIENPTFLPNYPALVDGYVHNLGEPYFVLQGHPNSWDDARWNSFVQILDFLQNNMRAEFVFAADYAPKP